MQSVISKTTFNHPKRTAPNNIWRGGNFSKQNLDINSTRYASNCFF